VIVLRLVEADPDKSHPAAANVSVPHHGRN
jgi:hypothetical protein